MLPLDLHVLSLPLAFILSQDQTLHCIISYIILSLSLTLIIHSKELTLLDKLFFSVLASCTVFSLFNELISLSCENPFFERGCKGTHYFLICNSFVKKFSKNFFEADLHASVLVRTQGLISHPFFKWECKGTTYFQTSKSFLHPERTKLRPRTSNSLTFTAVRHCYNFVKTRNCTLP